jgi:DNA-binding NarL/FixJ family response regulator
MKGLPPKTYPLRVAVQGELALVEALSAGTEQLILSPVETNLEISARVTQADVLVVDVANGGPGALEAIRTLQLKRPLLALVRADQTAEVMAAGAAGALLRTSSSKAIGAAIHALHAGLAVFDRSLVGQLAPEVHHVRATPTAGETLTPREREVLTLLADGLSNKEIAVKLLISEHTAKFHVNSILQKMSAQKRVEAVVRAARLGIIDL